MARLVMEPKAPDVAGHERIAGLAAGRLAALTPDQCPVDFTAALTRLFLSQSCGKCTPCRVGLSACANILEKVLAGEAEPSDLEALESTARVMVDASDCAIGFESGRVILSALDAFAADFASHVESDRCRKEADAMPPCQKTCPAHIDIPGYIACIEAGRHEDALRVIRNDNPLPTVCGYICEHPCEMSCRRSIVDDAVNICGLKRYAADMAKPYAAPAPLAPTGKSVAIIGGGPAGLSAAYYLSLMGHDVTIYEQREKLGGMVRYGIPDYRLPQERLDADIDFILSTGAKAKCGVSVGQHVTFREIAEGNDAVYISIGAHGDRKLGIDGEDATGVIPAVKFLRDAGEGHAPDLKGKRVVVVGGGNVAMDCTRTAKRLGASSVECVYRRRIADMTALPEEIEEALAEGCQITQLEAPVRIEKDNAGNVSALVTQPQVIGAVKGGRPAPYPADCPERTTAADVIIVAIGQAVETDAVESCVKTERGCIVAQEDGSVVAEGTVFAGGDAVSGPATVIRAIAAGKMAAANIDEAFGFRHDVHDHVDIPDATPPLPPTGRAELKDIAFADAAQTFDIAKIGLSCQEAAQESARCLRCDHHGFGATCRRKDMAW